MRRFIPTPSISEIGLGPFTIHFYALFIISGIALAIFLGDRRYRRAGGGENIVADVAIAAVPAGIIGGRLYHLITSPDAYFGSQGHPLDAFKIWEGGLGIWGAVSLGTLAAWWQHERMRRQGRPGLLSFAAFADALAPGILLAQAIGRLGNWFNGELFGKPTTLPWGLEIPLASRPTGFEGFQTFQPTFLYEALWSLLIVFLLISLERNFKPGQGFLFYISGYSVGRFFIELIRIDPAHTFAGLRVNVWVSLSVAIGSAYLFWRRGHRGKRHRAVSGDW
ncbi:MAG: prolipoprotein diacylglyceryl transferase [Actinobacteria bacterium]|nr:prolipoprotein diacylglyceryl transferase [Actinomycetota bacterium]